MMMILKIARLATLETLLVLFRTTYHKQNQVSILQPDYIDMLQMGQ